MADGQKDALHALYQAGCGAWPALLVPEARFFAFVSPHLDEGVDPGGLLAADLYLAAACAEGDGRALALFDEHVLSGAPQYLSSMRLDKDTIDDVRQLVRARLFVGTAEGPPRICSYGGRGSLTSWVRSMCVRTALNLREKKDEQVLHPGDAVTEKLVGSGGDPELGILKARYREAFHGAVRDAVAGLPEDQRSVLHLYLVEGLTTTRIGGLFQVNHTTVSRWLAAARGEIFEGTRRLLRQRLGLSEGDFDSIVRLLQSHLDVSLGGALSP